MSEYVKVFNDEDLKPEVLKEKGLVLVDFWATWCAPCRMLAPVVEEIAEELKDDLTVGKLDIDAYTDLAISKGIVSIPTLILFKDGIEVDRRIGVYPKQDLVAMIRNA